MTLTLRSNCDVNAQISHLFIYPVKSCAGIALDEARLTDTGLALDRTWMLVDELGVFMTQREHPRLALVHPHFSAHELILNAPGMPALAIALTALGSPTPVQLWDDTVTAFDMGREAALWFTDFLACSNKATSTGSYRLVRFNPEQRRVSSAQWTGDVLAYNQFSDGFPLLVLSVASLAQLNEKLMSAGHASIGIERFRPNIVLSGLQAHDEDWLNLMYVDAGKVILKPVKPCPRCPIPNVHPQTAEINREVGDTLQRYRKDTRLADAVTFGMNTIIIQGIGASLRVGQPVNADFV